MLRHGIQQWRPEELPLEWIELCVVHGAVYVASHDDRLIGSVTVMWDDPMVWGERSEPAGYIHLLMVDRRFGGHGIGRSLLNWAERSILEADRRVSRLDCARGNEKLRRYYEGAGYRFVEDQTFPDIDWALATALFKKRLRA